MNGGYCVSNEIVIGNVCYIFGEGFQISFIFIDESWLSG